MILTADYHTHTPYSHGENTVDENVAKAKEVGLKQIAISDHGYTHVSLGIRRRQTESYIADCKAAAEKYGIDVLVGIEANVCGLSGKADLTEKDYENFDVYLCGNHVWIKYDKFADYPLYCWSNVMLHKFLNYNPQWLIKRNTQAYINTIKRNPLDAVTHISYICPCDTLEVAKCAADYGTYIELNSKKTHLTDEQIMDMVLKTDVRFIVNSDAHSADRVGDTKRVEEQLARLPEFPMERIDNIDGRFPNFRFTEFKKHL